MIKKSFTVMMVLLFLVISSISYAAEPVFDPAPKAPSPSQYNSPAEYEKATGKKISQFSEAPSFSELVKQGKLPSVEKRLPEKPIVVVPVEEIGKYGGTWRMVMQGMADTPLLTREVDYEGLVRIDPELATVLPGVAESWKIGGNGRIFTFYLRKGLKWSDGHPFTADDVMFWYKDILLNKELTPVPPTYFTSEGEVVKVEKIDDYTVRFSFKKPAGLFLPNLATAGAGTAMIVPSHYLKQFHPNYVAKDKLDELVKKEKFNTWINLFNNKKDPWMNPELPVINAWKVVTPIGASTRISFERNPYYWKIDTAGNQLPYIDKITVDIATNFEVMKMKALSGEIDMQSRKIGQIISDYPLYAENKAKGGYRLIKQTHTSMNSMLIILNLNHKDPVLRKLFNDKRFRIALSHAINRQEIINLVYMGMVEPWQVSPRRGTPYFYEPAAKNYIEYDPKKANQLLDEIGLTKRDKDGFRLRPDGKTLEVTIEIGQDKTDWIDSCEMIKKYWQAVGIKVATKVEDRSLWQTRTAAGEHDIVVWWGDSGTGYEPLILPFWYLPCNHPSSRQAPLWALWYQSGGKQGETPPPEVRHQMALYTQISTTTDPAKQRELFRQILDVQAKNLYIMGICTIPPQFIITKNNFRNVPEAYESGQYPTRGPY
ncbi:MAG TPA: ABC transporter substrate-binding protein, partial [bacterium]|nr:ABC transporter substrate-binding protein [bacterium]